MGQQMGTGKMAYWDCIGLFSALFSSRNTEQEPFVVVGRLFARRRIQNGIDDTPKSKWHLV